MSTMVEPGEPTRVVIVDDHEPVRDALAGMLAGEPDLLVVGMACDGRDSLELCRRLRPDLVLMDVRMPGMDGLMATAALKRELPGTSVVMVTIHENPEYLLQAVRAGAAGYVLKEATKPELLLAIRKVLEGEYPFTRRLATQLLRRLVAEAAPPTQVLADPLTAREIEVLALLVQGQNNREIAEALNVSRSTIKAHVEHILGKLHVSDRTQAAVRAIELHLVQYPDGK